MKKIGILSSLLVSAVAFAGEITVTGSAAKALFDALPASTQETSSGKGFELVIRQDQNTVCREITLYVIYSQEIEDVKYDCTVKAK